MGGQHQSTLSISPNGVVHPVAVIAHQQQQVQRRPQQQPMINTMMLASNH
jgi:hypothetical protein